MVLSRRERVDPPAEFFEQVFGPAFFLEGHSALRVDEPGGGPDQDSFFLGEAVVEEDGEVVVLRAHPFADFVGVAVVVDGEDDDPGVAGVFLFELLVLGQFFDAVAAPDSPEVDDDDFAFERGQGDRVSVEGIGWNEGAAGGAPAREASTCLRLVSVPMTRLFLAY